MGEIFLIPTVLAENVVEAIPTYVLDAIKKCKVVFAENERTTRRYFKLLDKTLVIDNFEWHTIHKAEETQLATFKACITAGKNVAIVSEAGCPGIADPGQILVRAAQEMHCKINVFVGPSAILLALMASGLNGQQFEFVGYLPIEPNERVKKIKELESNSRKQSSTKIFIETPYRNMQLFDAIINHCDPQTQCCIAVDITASTEKIITQSVKNWRLHPPALHKRPAIFLLDATV